MKKIKFPILFAFMLTAMASLFLSSCSKEDDVTPTPQIADVSFHIDYLVGENPVVLGEVYDINGTAVSFDLISFYVGGIGFTDENGTTTMMDNKYLLINAEETHYEVGQLDAGHYEALQFFVGVDSTTNSQTEDDFTNRPAEDPLAIQNPSMHWSWASGYRFIRIDGKTDTDGDGIPETLIQYHLGTNPLLLQMQYGDTHKDLVVGENEYNLHLNLATVFEGVDMKTETSTHTMDNMMLANRIRNNFANALQIGQ